LAGLRARGVEQDVLRAHRFTARRCAEAGRQARRWEGQDDEDHGDDEEDPSWAPSFSVISRAAGRVSDTDDGRDRGVLDEGDEHRAQRGDGPRKACGRRTCESDWVKVSPIERAASACPAGTVLTPLRSASQTKAAW
jgi:hypothetical protein